MPFLEFRRVRSEEHTSELQSHSHLVCRLLLEKKKRRRCRARTRPPERSPSATTGASPAAASLPNPVPQVVPRAPPRAQACPPRLFFFKEGGTTEIYTLPLPDALPI